MKYLLLGLVIFIGTHSVRIVAEDWRTAMRVHYGEAIYKGLYSVLSVIGFGLIVWGFGLARETPHMLWLPPAGMAHLTALLMLPAFVLLVAAYVPANTFKARFHHPMLLAVKTWALAHLLATGNLANVVLFVSFLAWGVLLFIASRRRDRREKTQYPAATLAGTLTTVALGCAAWGIFAFVLHGLLIGIKPLG